MPERVHSSEGLGRILCGDVLVAAMDYLDLGRSKDPTTNRTTPMGTVQNSKNAIDASD